MKEDCFSKISESVLETISRIHIGFDYRINQIGISNHKGLKAEVDY